MTNDQNERINGHENGGSTPTSPTTPTARKATHTHLGLRPKKSDSLHTRLRTSNPAPKHVSKIVDVTSPTSLTAEGSTSKSVGKLSTRSSRNPSFSEVSHSREEEEYVTTDIGIYDDRVYDEYLGPVMGTIRRWLIRSLEWESPVLAKHQNLVRSPKLDRFFVYTSLVGSHSFFLIFLPVSFWLVSARFSRGLVNVLAFGVYFSSAIKDALCVPRPYSPPVTRLVIGTFHLEYGFLSTHSTNCISVVLYCYLWLREVRLALDPSSIMHGIGWEIGLSVYAIAVVYGRLYSGMHSIMDIIAGCALGALVTAAQWLLFEPLESMMETGGLKVPVTLFFVVLIMVTVHPQPLDDCPCFEDAIAFLAVVVGIFLSRWMNLTFGLLPKQDGPLTPKFRNSLPLFADMQSPSAASFIIGIGKIAIVMTLGIACVVATRAVVKTICKIALPPVFRFVQGTFGFILPRRHYTSSTDYAAMQKQNRQSAAFGSEEKESNEKSNGSVTRSDSHKRQKSWGGKGNGTAVSVWPTKADAEGMRQRMRSHSLQQQLSQHTNGGDAEGNTVKFTMGDGKDIPFPVTHPNTQLPGDGLSQRIAGALSNEERERQRHESTASTNASHLQGLHKVATMNGEEETFDVAHYDVDVLSKVFVYTAVGLTAGGLIPASLTYLGLLPI
ncbi:uncharacterized protein FA14DRAFT_167969 [Meira miltonrushii]|uniref:Phosphatidic acid phosphatase type 2/haloperoxidase domain-containing protein n=1 Tax=Meira miltonrushii TaxID=1280837 RepID=A0A316VF16_9BASI|nr:uncharacterized protein FA14DRAFT_167969 [Meira miltonrushii]PWN36219.1 hypothetical protein FA14DRAFT_167969 [Meira miltonrushii]